LPPKKNLKSSFPLRFKARRAEGGCGGNSARRAQPVPFGYFQTDTASWEMKQLARPLRGLASRFSPKIQAVLNEVKASSGLFSFLIITDF